MALEVMTALEGCKVAGEIVKYLWSIRSKLVAQPEPAAQDLGLALEQVHATFRAVASEIARFKGLGVTPEALREGSSILTELEGTMLRARVDAARGHCTVIDNIYRAHLDKWFRGKLSEEEYEKVKEYFSLLGMADNDLFVRMCSICDSLSREATLVLDMVLEEKWAQARERILSSRQALREVEQSIASAMGMLSDLKTELIAISGVTHLG